MLIQADLGAVADAPARGRRRRRAAQPRGHRAGAAGLGPDDPRRLRPDRDDRADRQHARASRSSPARWAGRCPATRSCCSTRDGEPADEGEICLDLSQRPLGLMAGYRDDDERTAEAMRGGYYHTGDVAPRDADGYITYVGRADDVFKASDYRISPFELESVLIEHEAVAEAAVVPTPDPLRLAVPKAFVVLAAGLRADRDDRARRSCATRASTWRRTSASAGSSSPSCRRRSPARSAASSCAPDEERDQSGGYSEADFPELRLLGLLVATPDVGGRAALSLRAGRVPNRARRHGPEERLSPRQIRTGCRRPADGTRPRVVRDTFAYVLDGSGRQIGGALPRGGTAVIAEMRPTAGRSPRSTSCPRPAPRRSAARPAVPAIAGFVPYLFSMAPPAPPRGRRARGGRHGPGSATGWCGPTRGTAPFPVGICLLAQHVAECEREVARDLGHDLFNPAFSPMAGWPRSSRRRVRRSGWADRPLRHGDGGAGPPADRRRRQPTVVVTRRPLIAFARGGDIFVVPAAGGPRVASCGAVSSRSGPPPGLPGRPPPRLRVERTLGVVTAARRSPAADVTLRSDGHRVARRTVRATPAAR